MIFNEKTPSESNASQTQT